VEAARARPLPRLTGLILEDIAYGKSLAGRAAEARADFAEALQIWTTIGAKRNIVSLSVVMAEHLFLAGEVAAAIELANNAIARLRQVSFSRSLVTALNNLAAYYIACDRFDEARAQAREALDMAAETQTDVALTWSLQHLSAIGALSGGASEKASRAERAAGVLGYVDARLAELGSPRTLPEQNEYNRARGAISASLGHAAVDALVLAGATITRDRAIEVALSF
jgi:tetratricopeptide (TPR) repeat protein